MRFGVFYKWLLSLLLTLGVVISLILLVVNWSFQEGFVSYARQTEKRQVERFVSVLTQAYERHGSWRFLREDPSLWPQLLASAGISVPPQMREPPPPRQPFSETRPPDSRTTPVPGIRAPGPSHGTG